MILLTETGNITETRNENQADQSRAKCINITAKWMHQKKETRELNEKDALREVKKKRQ
jgi:hypothetical protein